MKGKNFETGTKKSIFNEFSKFRRRLLSQQESESLLNGDSLPAVLVFRRKPTNQRINKIVIKPS